jgi:hypothetical protein
VLLLLWVLAPESAVAQTAPKLASVFPFGGGRGTSTVVEIRGTSLEGTHAVWLGPQRDGIEASIAAVPDAARVKIRLAIAAAARAGFHDLSLISPGGLSGSVRFWVGPHRVEAEAAEVHNTAATAQPVTLPVAVNGRITAGGEVDYYGFDVGGEQTVAFAVIALHGANFDPQLALYEAGGSFLDPQRPKRLLFREEVTQGSMPASRRLTYHFTKPGRYVVSLANVFAQAGGEFTYLLQIAPAEPPAADDALTWARQQLELIRSRSLATPAVTASLVSEAEPNDRPEQGKAFNVPAVLEGTIGRPGDIDCFRLKGKAGQKLVLEVQTPRVGPPHFSLRVDMLDAKGALALSNLRVQDGKLGTVDAEMIKVASQVEGTLEKDGEYCVRIRNVSAIHGSADHAYRVLVRPPIPHLGEVRFEPAGPVNLAPGGQQRLTFKASPHEGYAGSFALSVEGVPPGVRAFLDAKNSSVELLADVGAPFTSVPQLMRVWGLPVADGKSGTRFQVDEIPVMVLKK